MRPTEATLARLAAAAGNAIRDAHGMEPYLREWRGLWFGRTPLVLRPGGTAEVAAVMRIASETRTVIVPQSGNTGLVGGQIPDESGDQVLLSLDRMARIRGVDAEGNSITVDAGVTLKAVQDAAEAADRLFPLSLASEGSCRIGGNLSTNAGGTGVLAYGNARDLCLGLEVVLADGRVWTGLNSLRKNNTGYDLKNLFIGAEGTLGIITAASLRLFPRPTHWATALAALDGPQAALDLLNRAQAESGGRVTAIELMPRIGIEFVMAHFDMRDPFPSPAPWYALIELSGGMAQDAALEVSLGETTRDAVIAGSLAQRAQLWNIREWIVEVQRREGGSIKHDVSVPVSAIPDFVEDGLAAVSAVMPEARPMPFGHAGDGNLHFNVSQPAGWDKAAFLAHAPEISEAVYSTVLKHGGSISAEHGIGRAKLDLMARVKSPVELQMMRALKSAFDPLNILNPGKVLPPP